MTLATQEQQAAPVRDRRSQRTRVALRDALAEEIYAAGDLSQVTVTAVTNRADVTRRTFYSHYRDIADLVRSVEDEAIEELRPYVNRVSETTLDQLEEAIGAFSPSPGSVELLTHIKEHDGYLAALLGEGGDPSLSQRLCDMVCEQAHDRVSQGFIIPDADVLIDYYLTFVISAEVGVLVRWMTGGMKEPVEVISRMMTALLFIRPGDLYGRPIGFDIPATASKFTAKREEISDGPNR